MKVTVSANWMRACGYPAVDTEMDVICVLGKTPSGEIFYKVMRPDGIEWVVAEFRLVKSS
jgi:hypothetical protein